MWERSPFDHQGRERKKGYRGCTAKSSFTPPLLQICRTAHNIIKPDLIIITTRGKNPKIFTALEHHACDIVAARRGWDWGQPKPSISID
jgi:hypothetical protein